MGLRGVNAIGFLMIMLLASFLGGCGVIDHVAVGKTPYVVCDGGTVRRFYPLQGSVYALGLFFVPIEGSLTHVYLWRTSARPSTIGLGRSLAKLPRSLNADDLEELAEAIGPPYPVAADPWAFSAEGPYSANQVAVRWIISLDPLVVAMGTESTNMRIWGGGRLLESSELELGDTFALAGEADLDRTASELVVLDRWPLPWRVYGEDPQGALAAQVAPLARRVPLAQPQSLRELMAARPWERASAALPR